MPRDHAPYPSSIDDAHGRGVESPDGAPSSAEGGTYFLGRYRVVDEIGVGGMASVHLARMDGPGGFQKWVAIKRIHPHLVEDDTFVQMFLDEARIAARISHPNVATVFDVGKHQDTYWIAMEYLHGEPLRELMRRCEETHANVPPEIACRLIADAAEGLHAAHELTGKNGEALNLVHRDVTPHNLFVTYDGTTKVVDFGIAKFASRNAQTRAGTLKGKLAYMSPEQVHGEVIDRRTDVFALGVVLWELTTGQRLFRMDNDLDTLAKVQECAVPRPSTLVRAYPVDLEKIVMKALAKNRGERFKTARELSRALQGLLMRRGLFVASDEVSTFMLTLMKDRVERREAHLRWAAEVTRTIDVDRMLGPPAVEQFSALPPGGAAYAPPRPAAGMPPRSTGAPGSEGSAPRPAAGAKPTVPPPRTVRHGEPHPADGDGPTIQADPPDMGEDDVDTARRRASGLPIVPSFAAPDDDDQLETQVVGAGHSLSVQAAPAPVASVPDLARTLGLGHPIAPVTQGAFDPSVPLEPAVPGLGYAPAPPHAAGGALHLPIGGLHVDPNATQHVGAVSADGRGALARLPLWAVALLSCAVTLLVLALALMMWSRSEPAGGRAPERVLRDDDARLAFAEAAAAPLDGPLPSPRRPVGRRASRPAR